MSTPVEVARLMDAVPVWLHALNRCARELSPAGVSIMLVVVPEAAPDKALFGSNVAAHNVPALRRALEEALEQYELERHAVETFARMPTEGSA